MNKINIFLLFTTISMNCLGQVHFEKGYFITNENKRIDCLIKNKDWLKNPKTFNYKLSEDGDIKTADITGVKEFSISNASRFLRADVDIDTSSSLLAELSIVKNPLWKHQQLFLKILVEGKATLYYYYEGKYERFFYSCNDTIIKQLIHKEYIYRNPNENDNQNEQTVFNNSFRQQLFTNVSCPNATMNSVANLEYDKKELVKYFQRYNACVDLSYKAIERKQVKGDFKLGIFNGLNCSSLSISNESSTYPNVKFNYKPSYSFGIELEYNLPFNKNKWGVVAAPVYQSYKSQKEAGSLYEYTINYSSVDLLLGVKHYFYINDNTKFFAGGYINSLLSYRLNSTIEMHPVHNYGYGLLSLKVKSQPNIALGAGFEHKRFFTEFRYFSNQGLLNNYQFWHSSYRKVSLMIGYKIIKTRRNKP